jgi:hypothetical protein
MHSVAGVLTKRFGLFTRLGLCYVVTGCLQQKVDDSARPKKGEEVEGREVLLGFVIQSLLSQRRSDIMKRVSFLALLGPLMCLDRPHTVIQLRRDCLFHGRAIQAQG